MNIQCPKCRAAFAVKSQPQTPEVFHCVCCGADFDFIPGLCLLFGRVLDDTADGFPRLACPHCGQHYAVKYPPENAVVQCACCLHGFAMPDSVMDQLKRLFADPDRRRG